VVGIDGVLGVVVVVVVVDVSGVNPEIHHNTCAHYLHSLCLQYYKINNYFVLFLYLVYFTMM